MSIPDRNERAQQRRRREARARNVLTVASVLSLAAGTATIYAANTGTSEADEPALTPVAVLKPVFIPDPTATAVPSIPTPTPTPEPAVVERDEEGEDEYDDDDEYEDDENESTDRTSLPNVTVPPMPTSGLDPTPTPDAPQIVVEQPSSHSRSHSTPG